MKEYRRLCETLKQNATLNLTAQKKVLEITFTDWKGNLDQVDDVLLVESAYNTIYGILFVTSLSGPYEQGIAKCMT